MDEVKKEINFFRLKIKFIYKIENTQVPIVQTQKILLKVDEPAKIQEKTQTPPKQ